jgi:hypothetical protein
MYNGTKTRKIIFNPTRPYKFIPYLKIFNKNIDIFNNVFSKRMYILFQNMMKLWLTNIISTNTFIPKCRIKLDNEMIFIKNQLQINKGVKVILWETDKNIKNLETITIATNGSIIDGHFSYQAHMDFSKWIIGKIESAKTTKNDWI